MRRHACVQFQFYANFSGQSSITLVAKRITEHLSCHIGPGFAFKCTSGQAVPDLPAGPQRHCPTAEVGIYCGFPKESVFLQGVHRYLVGIYVCEASRIPDSWVKICNRHDLILVPSEYCRRAFVDSGVVVPVEVLRHGVDEPCLGAAAFDMPKSLLHVFNANPFYSRKGIEELLEAWARLRTDYPDWTLILKTTASPWTQGWQRPGVQVVCGHYQRESLLALYQRVAGLVFPSRAEGFGLPPLEALAAGCPVIAPFHSGMAEYLSESRDTIIPGPWLPEPLATWDNPNGELYGITAGQIESGLRAFLSDPELARARARDFDCSRWLWREVLAGLPDRLNELIGQPPVYSPAPALTRDYERVVKMYLGPAQAEAYRKDPTGLGVVVSELGRRLPVTENQDAVLLAPFNPEHCQFSTLGVPVVAYTTFESDRWPAHWVRELNSCMMVLVPQAWVADALKASGCRVPIRVVPQAHKNPRPERRAGQAPRPFTFGFLGVPVARKNLDMIARCLPPDTRLLVRAAWVPSGVVVPQGPSIRYLPGQMSDAVLDEQFWSEVDCLVCPSAGEGYSMVPREAIAAGIPVIVSDIPAHADLDAPKIKTAPGAPARYEFLGGRQCGCWGAVSEDHLRSLMAAASARSPVVHRPSSMPVHSWDSTVALALNEIQHPVVTFCPAQDAGGGIDRFARQMMAHLPGLKYITTVEDLERFAPVIGSLILQFEYGLYSPELLDRIRSIIGAVPSPTIRCSAIVHSASGLPPEEKTNQALRACATSGLVLLNPGQMAAFATGTYIEHPWPTPGRFSKSAGPALGTHGFIHRQKNYAAIFDVAQSLGRPVLIAGRLDRRNPANLACFSAQIQSRLRPDDTMIEAYLPDDELRATMSKAAALLYPYEPWRNIQASGAVRSAIQFGRPMLVSDISDYFDMPEDAFPRLPLGDPQEMARRVEEVLRSAESWYKKQAAHARARSWSWFVSRIKEVLHVHP